MRGLYASRTTENVQSVSESCRQHLWVEDKQHQFSSVDRLWISGRKNSQKFRFNAKPVDTTKTDQTNKFQLLHGQKMDWSSLANTRPHIFNSEANVKVTDNRVGRGIASTVLPHH